MTGQATATSRVAPRSASRLPRRFLVWLSLAFAIRLAFGITSEFWGPDELQVYLIGLEFFTTGIWPLYGPDVVYTETQIPGGLQGLLIGGPLWLVPQPEAPYVLLNLLSFAALLLLAWYIGRRLPAFPRWFLWPWVLFSPWTLNVSAHVINTSYVLAGAVAFFVGACEIVPALRRDIVPRSAAFFGLGFGLLWVYQLHLSALLLGPVALAVVLLAARDDRLVARRGLPWAALGALASGWTLLPTLISEGLEMVAHSAGPNVVFEPANLLRMPQIVAQFFALPTLEVARFIGAGTDQRFEFLARHWWAAPFVLGAAGLGVAQTATLILGLFQRRSSPPDWRAIQSSTALLLTLLVVSFIWSVRPPASHTFYVVLPAVMIYAAYVWAPWLEHRRLRSVAVVLLVCAAVTQAAIAWRNFTSASLYTDRATVVRAIDERNHRIVGIRRPELWRAKE